MVEYPLEIFCSFAPQDEVWLHKLVVHLRLLEREGLVLIWHNRLLKGGMNWAQEIDDHLNHATLILLLLSPDFIASDYCYGIEMRRALERHEAHEARVIPLLVRPVENWQLTPFGHLQALPSSTFLVEWSEREEDIPLAQIARGIRALVEDLLRPPARVLGISRPVTWNVPYPRNPFFTGREAELHAIEAALEKGQNAAIVQAQALSGLGGIGKTQLALEYVYRYRAAYRFVFWSMADTRDTLNVSYSEIASLLCLPVSQYREQNLVVEAVKSWLAEHQDWLLILDNADDLRVIRDFLPLSAFGHILLTTRAHAMGQLAERIEVRKLEIEEGTTLLLRRCTLLHKDASLKTLDVATREAARAIVWELDGLPLALDQAGAYIEETNCSLHDYLNLFRSRRAELLRLRGSLIVDHPESVATTWQLAFDRLEASNVAAADFLRLCAFLAPDDIPETIVGPEIPSLPLSLQQLAHDSLQLNAALATLQHYSLVTRHSDTHRLDMHRLVQAVLRDAMAPEVEREWAERAVQIVRHLFPKPEVANWEMCRQLLPHAQTCATLLERWLMRTTGGAALLYDMGWYLYEQGIYQEAQQYIEQALEIFRMTVGEHHSDTARCFNKLGLVYYGQGRYAEAEAAHQQAISIREKGLGAVHPLVASPLSGLADLYWKQGRYAEAEPLFQRAISIREKGLGADHPLVANSLNGLACLYGDQGKYAEAEPLFQRAISIREQSLGPGHLLVAYSLSDLAELYELQDKDAEAEQLYQRAISIWEQHPGPEHSDVAYPLQGLANVYSKHGQYTEAEPLYQRALRMREQHLGFEHSEVADTLHAFATLRERQGNHQEARALYQRALAIREQALGSAHPKTTETRTCLLTLLQRMGQHEEATQLEMTT